MNELEKAVRECVFDELCVFCTKRVYTHCEYMNKTKNEPICKEGKVVYNKFISGVQWQAKQSPWIRTENKMPEDNELVLTSSSIYGTKLLVWNEFHKVWDDEDGDDTYCDRDKIDAWMPIPE